jgi:predicted RNase H-like nuclease (RuvC/YqgF family)
MSKNSKSNKSDNDPKSEVVDISLRELNEYRNVYEMMKTQYIKTGAEIMNVKKWEKMKINEMEEDIDKLINELKIRDEKIALLEKNNKPNKKLSLIKDDLVQTTNLEDLHNQMKEQAQKETPIYKNDFDNWNKNRKRYHFK